MERILTESIIDKIVAHHLMTIDRQRTRLRPAGYGSNFISIKVQDIGHQQSMPGISVVVEAHGRARDNKYNEQRQDHLFDRYWPGRPIPAREPDQQKYPGRYTRNKALKRTTVGNDCQPQRHYHGIARALFIDDTTQTTKKERAAQ